MARTALIPVAAPGCYSNPVDVGMTAADVGNMNQFTMSGNDLLLFQVAATPYTVTLTSIADAQGRTGDITTFSIPANKTYMWGPVKQLGWAQPGNLMYLAGSNAGLLIGVIRLG